MGFRAAFQNHPDGIETEKQVVPEVLQAARRPHSDFPAQDQAQVERRHMNQQPLQDVPMPPQMRPPHSARVVDMRKRSFEELSPPAQELFAPLAPDAPPIPRDRRLLASLAVPLPPPSLRLGTVGPYPDLPQSSSSAPL